MQDEKKALQLFIGNFAVNILRNMELGAITFERAVYLLREDLDNIKQDPHKYCAESCVKFEGF